VLTHSDPAQIWGMADTVETVPGLVDLSSINEDKMHHLWRLPLFGSIYYIFMITGQQL